MQPSDHRNLSEAELDVRTRELEEELFMLQLRRSTSQLENPMKLRAVRRDLARCRTIHHERAKAS